MNIDSKRLRRLDESEAADISRQIARLPLYIVLEDVLDTYNIGGFFRLADAISASELFICGQSATPPDTKIRKASVGTHKLVPWRYFPTAAEAISELKSQGVSVFAVEQSSVSIDYRQIDADGEALAFVFGNETHGLKPETLDICRQALEIPMLGANKSLNVMVAAGIAIYHSLAKKGWC